MSNDLIVEVTEGGFTLHEEDEWYEGVIDSIARESAEDSKFGNAQFIWRIALDKDNENNDGDEPNLVWYFTTAKLTTNERNKLRSTIKALTGRFPDVGETPNLGDFIGERVKVMFEHYEGTDQDGKPQTKDKIIKMKATS